MSVGARPERLASQMGEDPRGLVRYFIVSEKLLAEMGGEWSPPVQIRFVPGVTAGELDIEARGFSPAIQELIREAVERD